MFAIQVHYIIITNYNKYKYDMDYTGVTGKNRPDR